MSGVWGSSDPHATLPYFFLLELLLLLLELLLLELLFEPELELFFEPLELPDLVGISHSPFRRAKPLIRINVPDQPTLG